MTPMGKIREVISDTPHLVGEYYGKPLYEMSMKKTGLISSATRYFETELTALNIAKIMKVYVSYDLYNSNDTFVENRGEYYASSSDYIQGLLSQTFFYTKFQLASGWTLRNLEVIFKFTQT